MFFTGDVGYTDGDKYILVPLPGVLVHSVAFDTPVIVIFSISVFPVSTIPSTGG
jgi:hypothetical protein